jgi:hypothetical protein
MSVRLSRSWGVSCAEVALCVRLEVREDTALNTQSSAARRDLFIALYQLLMVFVARKR